MKISIRGGSKRVPRKNLRLLEGKPLIPYVLKTALSAETLTKVVVSTEVEEIASFAKAWGSKCHLSDPQSLHGMRSSHFSRRPRSFCSAKSYLLYYALNRAIFVRKRALLESWGGSDFAPGKDVRAIVIDAEMRCKGET